MILLNENTKSKIKKHSLGEHPNECCGIFIEKNGAVDVVECKNQAIDKKLFFEIGPDEYLKAEQLGDIKGYYHSHTEDNFCLSGADIAVSLSLKLPLIMYSTINNKFTEYLPS